VQESRSAGGADDVVLPRWLEFHTVLSLRRNRIEVVVVVNVAIVRAGVSRPVREIVRRAGGHLERRQVRTM